MLRTQTCTKASLHCERAPVPEVPHAHADHRTHFAVHAADAFYNLQLNAPIAAPDAFATLHTPLSISTPNERTTLYWYDLYLNITKGVAYKAILLTQMICNTHSLQHRTGCNATRVVVM